MRCPDKVAIITSTARLQSIGLRSLEPGATWFRKIILSYVNWPRVTNRPLISQRPAWFSFGGKPRFMHLLMKTGVADGGLPACFPERADHALSSEQLR